MSKADILLETGTNEFEVIEFFIEEAGQDGEEPLVHSFGINVAKVLEVIESPKLRRPKSAPHPSFMGTIPLREKVLALVDLGVCLNIQRQVNHREVILVTEFNRRTTGFIVSGVNRIHRVQWSEVQPPSHYLTRLETNCITGVVRLDEHFSLLLDLEKILSDMDPDFAAEMSKDIGKKAPENYHVLVAEDSTMMRLMLKQKLEEANFLVEDAQNGVEAWDRLSALKGKGDVLSHLQLVVSDIEMPAMDGYTLTRKIKEDPELSRLPVVLFSSMSSEELRHKGAVVGADDQISKPEFGELTDRCLQVIAKALG